MDAELAESLRERTLESLDFDYVVEKLRQQCCTAPALALAAEPEALLADSPEEARALYAMVMELAMLEDADLELSESLDIRAQMEACASGQVLEAHQLRDVSVAVEAFQKLRIGLERAAVRGLQMPKLLSAVRRIELPDDLLDCMLEAFTEEGELSELKFPELGEKRRRIRELEELSADAIRNVLGSGRYARFLADDGYMNVGGRYVLSVKRQGRSKVGGEVLDESRSGETLYVEPRELRRLSAELVELNQDLKFLGRRILARMCVAVSRASSALTECLQAAGEIDLARARLFLGEDMEGEVPEVGDEGVIMARHARNPCLLLRGGTRVVGNRLELGGRSQGLILSGPNAGGKTVVLKTLGLLTLLVRCGIPVPAGESARVDFFDVVLAEIGDMQTIVDDLSTYSAHLVASRIMLQCTENSGVRGLVMVDEAGTGTDPMQGAALARAVLEGLLATNARVVATTHCSQLKDWALGDPRTEIVAMEYKNGRPTFKVVRNALGESHAIETARRLELPRTLVRRAEELLDEDQRSLLALQRKAEELERQLKVQLGRAEEREAKALAAERSATKRSQALADRETAMHLLEAELMERQERFRNKLRTEHRLEVDAHARRLHQVVQTLREQVEEGGGGLRLVGDAIEELRVERDEAAAEAARVAALRAKRAKLLPGALTSADKLVPGDRVMVLARTTWYGFRGSVQQVLGSGDVQVMLDPPYSRTLKLKKAQLGRAPRVMPKKEEPAKPKARDYSKMMW